MWPRVHEWCGSWLKPFLGNDLKDEVSPSVILCTMTYTKSALIQGLSVELLEYCSRLRQSVTRGMFAGGKVLEGTHHFVSTWEKNRWEETANGHGSSEWQNIVPLFIPQHTHLVDPHLIKPVSPLLLLEKCPYVAIHHSAGGLIPGRCSILNLSYAIGRWMLSANERYEDLAFRNINDLSQIGYRKTSLNSVVRINISLALPDYLLWTSRGDLM